MRGFLAGASLLVLAGSVAAGPVGTISDPALVITATSSLGTADFTVPVGALDEFMPGQFRFLQLLPLALIDGNNGNTIATLGQATLVLNPNSQISMGFSLTSGDADTQISISSAVLSFAPGIDSAIGSATAAMTLTDVQGNGASFTGTGPGGSSYSAHYNGAAPGGSIFASGIAGLSTGGSDDDNFGVLNLPIGSIVDNMSAQYSFTMSANDLVSGTSTYTVTPEPSSLALMALAALAARRRC
jgi:hypothetical protein